MPARIERFRVLHNQEGKRIVRCLRSAISLIIGSLAEGARVTAARLKMNQAETEALVQRFVGYAHELSGPNVKPVPPFLFEISKDSRDHSREV